MLALINEFISDTVITQKLLSNYKKTLNAIFDNETQGLFLNSIGQYCLHNDLLYFDKKIKFLQIETFARNSPFARGIPPNRKKTKNGNEISKTMAKSWIKSPNGC